MSQRLKTESILSTVPASSAANSALRLLRNLFSKRIVRDTATVAAGTAVAQAITIAFYPIIARLYGPEAFGVLGVFMSVVVALASIAGLAYPIAIVLPKSDADAGGLARLSLAIALSIAAATALILAAFSESIIVLFRLEPIASFIFLLPVVVIFTTLLATTQQWLIRTRQFSVTARVAVLQALIVNGAKAGLGLVQPLASTLILIATAGFALHAGMLELGRRLSGTRRQDPFPDEPKKSLPELARAHRDFPLFRAPQELLNALSHGLPVILLAAFYGPKAAGFYALAYSVLAAPIRLIGRSVGSVLYPRLAEAAHRGEDLRRLVLLPTRALFLMGLVPFGTIMVAGPVLFAFAFGDEWRDAGNYAQWLSLWLLAGFVNAPSVKVIPIINEQKRFLLFGGASVIMRALSVCFAFYVGLNHMFAVIFISISGAFLNIILIFSVIYEIYRLRSGNSQ